MTQSVLHKERRWSAGRVTSPEAAWAARKEHMVRQPAGTFHSHNFRAVIHFILKHKDRSVKNEDLESLVHIHVILSPK